MPTVFRQDGCRFFFYSNEGDPREPVHVHVMRDENEAKFWVVPEVGLAYNYGFSRRTLSMLADLLAERAEDIIDAWNDHFA